MTGSAIPGGGLRRMLLDNLLLKLLSVFIAASLWYFLSSEPLTERIVEVPLEIINKPVALDIANSFDKNILLTVQTLAESKEPLATVIVATLDLRDAREGENTFLLLPRNFRVPPSVKHIVRINPPSLSIRLEKHSKRTVPVRCHCTGSPPANYRMVRVSCFPAVVEITGPDSKVLAVRDIPTRPIDISAETSRIVRYVNLVLENPFINVGFCDPVRVEIDIQPMADSEQ